MSTKEHCHGCGKLWSEESPDCVFNYHKKPETKNNLSCPWCGDDAKFISNYGDTEFYRCKSCNRVFTIRRGGMELVKVA